jgi:DNA-binding NtrC family response regulator
MRTVSPQPGRTVEPLRPIHVLVSTPDRPYLAAAMFFLTRRRMVVRPAGSPETLVRTVDSIRPDVVVLDVTDSMAAAARAAGAIEGRHPCTRVLLVTDSVDELPASARTLAKWAGLERLGDAVVHAYGAAAD